MKKDEVIAKNLLISAEFDKFVIEHPEVLDQIPDGAQLIFLPEYDPELCAENLKLSKSVTGKKKPIIYIKLNKLSHTKIQDQTSNYRTCKGGINIRTISIIPPGIACLLISPAYRSE